MSDDEKGETKIGLVLQEWDGDMLAVSCYLSMNDTEIGQDGKSSQPIMLLLLTHTVPCNQR